jgi:adenylate cyclase
MSAPAGLIVAFLALVALAGLSIALRRWRVEYREAARVRATFARYVAPSVVDLLLSRKDERLFTGRAVRATILVCRIRDFAHFIEPLTPEQTLRYLNELYGLAGTAIQRHRGVIDSFLGDGIVAVFGVPLENPTQEDDALQAALDIVRHVVAMRERWAKQNRKAFTVGIGVNTGEVIAGDAGFRDRREFTVVGSEATFAHRLQEAAFALNAFIVAADATCESLAAEYRLVPLRGVPLPGIRRLLDAYVVRGRIQATEFFTVPVGALVETAIEPASRAVEPVAAAAAGSATVEEPLLDGPIPDGPILPFAVQPFGRRRWPAAGPAGVEPEFGRPDVPSGWMFDLDEVHPIVPDAL